MRRFYVPVTALVLALPGAAFGQATRTAEAAAPARVDADQMLEDVRFLASDALLGRRTGTPGNARAREYLVDAFRRVGLQPMGLNRPGFVGELLT